MPSRRFSRKEAQDGGGMSGVNVEAAVEEFENPYAAFDQFSKLRKDPFGREKADAFFKRGKTIFAMERTTARGFDVDAAMGNVFVGVFIVGQSDGF